MRIRYVRYDPTSKKYEIVFEYNPAIVTAIKRIPERSFDWNRKIWTLPNTSGGYLGLFLRQFDFSIINDEATVNALRPILSTGSTPEDMMIELENQRVLAWSKTPEALEWGVQRIAAVIQMNPKCNYIKNNDKDMNDANDDIRQLLEREEDDLWPF